MPVLEAVRASTSYPFVFEPLVGEFEGLDSPAVLVDGGLSSNLPSFLFHSEVQSTHYPTLAFDIVVKNQKKTEVMTSMSSFVEAIISTSVTASDNLILEVIRGVYHIPIAIDDSIETFDIDLTQEKRTIAFLSGYASCNEALANNELIKLSKCIDGDVQDELELMYGSPALYTPVLFHIKEQIGAILSDSTTDTRVSLYLPTPNNSIISLYSAGFEEAPKHHFSLNEDKIVCNAYNENKFDWNDIEKQDERFVLAIPVESSGHIESPRDNVIAVLCVDCKVKLIDKFDIFDDSGDLSNNVFSVLDLWVPILKKLIGPTYLS